MDNTTFPEVAIGDLEPHQWVRLSDGEVGVIHDKVDHPGYRKVCVEVPDARHPIRILPFDCVVQHVVDRATARKAALHAAQL